MQLTIVLFYLLLFGAIIMHSKVPHLFSVPERSLCGMKCVVETNDDVIG